MAEDQEAMRIVAELGINTNGSLDTALRMVEAAAEAGADGIKAQCYEVQDFLPEGHPDWALFEENRLSWPDIEKVFEETVSLGLEFGATPTSQRGVEFLSDLRVDWLKNGSDFLLRTDLIDSMLRTGLETWVSTGMATWKEITEVPSGAKIMACTSLYPCPPEEAQLGRLDLDGYWETTYYDGYSDHTRSLLTAPLCVALGAEMYETHFSLSHDMEGPDHAFSRDPDELTIIVAAVREAKTLIGKRAGYEGWNSGHSPAEAENRRKWRVTKDTLRG